MCAQYTAVMVLTNAMTPPHLAPFANGLAQSSASAARFCGPVYDGSMVRQTSADELCLDWAQQYGVGLSALIALGLSITITPSTWRAVYVQPA